MTSKQKEWLDAHPGFAVVGVAGGFARWTRRTVLHTNGQTEPVRRGLRVADGAFLVGVLEVGPPGSAPDPRADMSRTVKA